MTDQTWAAPTAPSTRGNTALEMSAASGGVKTSYVQVFTYGCGKYILVDNRSTAWSNMTPEGATGAAGTLADGVHDYQIIAYTASGHTASGDGKAVTVTGAAGSGSVELTWTAPTGGPADLPVTGYALYRNIDSAGWFMSSASVTGTASGITDDGALDFSVDEDPPSGNTSACEVSIAVATVADQWGRTVDSATVQPITVAAGATKVIGPFPANLYGKGTYSQDVQLTLTTDDPTKVYLTVIDPNYTS